MLQHERKLSSAFKATVTKHQLFSLKDTLFYGDFYKQEWCPEAKKVQTENSRSTNACNAVQARRSFASSDKLIKTRIL
jgi:hypothetical protein